MHQNTTAQNLRDLGESIAADGITAHESALAAVAAQVRSADPTSVLADIIADLTAPPVVRCRALAHATAEWSRLGPGRSTATRRQRPQPPSGQTSACEVEALRPTSRRVMTA